MKSKYIVIATELKKQLNVFDIRNFAYSLFQSKSHHKHFI